LIFYVGIEFFSLKNQVVIMKLSFSVVLALPHIALGSILEERQACYQDNCLRAINGTRRGPNHPATGSSNCIEFMTTSVLVDPMYVAFLPDQITANCKPSFTTATTTVRTTITDPCTTDGGIFSTSSFSPDPSVIQGDIPFYATSACPSERYSSACSCLGVTSGTITTTSAVSCLFVFV
jgi:hypothetical protein